MDASQVTAGWLSFAVTAIGLGSLITQTSAIKDRLDPYHLARTVEHLGPWIHRQPRKSMMLLAQPIPVGPILHAKLTEGFCGVNQFGLSRLPRGQIGNATWTRILAIYHEQLPFQIAGSSLGNGSTATDSTSEMKDRGRDANIEAAVIAHSPHYTNMPWAALRTQPLRRHNSRTFISISRVTLITILIICNAGPVFRYSDSSGHRASYTSYIGLFYIEWPIGAPAMVHFHPLDSHAAETDVFPPVFQVRVDKCVQMLAGVITSADGRSFKCALTGRKQPGYWALEYLRKSYMGAHGSRHLYTMMGGNVAEVDFLYARRVEGVHSVPGGTTQLHLPTTEPHVYNTMFVLVKEREILEHILDYLPWSSLSWSIHRGMKDILVAFAKNTVDKHRHTLANMLRDFISSNHRLFEINGWSASFVRGTMPDSAANTVLAGGGNSGDAIRVVTDAVLLYTGKKFGEELDETTFWRRGRHDMTEGFTLATDAMIALTKCIVLEWSIDFDYQMHDDLPLELLLG